MESSSALVSKLRQEEWNLQTRKGTLFSLMSEFGTMYDSKMKDQCMHCSLSLLLPNINQSVRKNKLVIAIKPF